ncbi:MAG: alpha/beta hydrolase [Corynebacterium sp.]|nr:alpha/beta hydrolase [Corynebacterium sp.]
MTAQLNIPAHLLDPRSWQPDILGPEFSQLTLPLGQDPDERGNVIATLVRYNPSVPSVQQTHDTIAPGTAIQGGAPTIDATDFHRPAILWVHGMTDYFFQAHVAKAFHDAGYAFYALDLRKCGRSHLPDQRWHYISDLRYYYAELNLALKILLQSHAQVITLAHSTGGLVVALWLDHLRRTQPDLHARIPASLFNSPWWDPQTAGVAPRVTRIAKLAFPIAGRLVPLRSYGSNSSGTYGKSLHESAQGRWEYNTTYKPFGGHTRYFGWLRAIIRSQGYIAYHGIDIGMPGLAMFAADSDQAPDSSDIVLDVAAQISQAPNIGPQLAIVQIPQAIHDISLSSPQVTKQAFGEVQRWLQPLVN